MSTKAEAKTTAPAVKKSHSSFPQNFAVGAILIVCAALIAFGPAIKAGFIWDDNDMLTENHLIKAADGLRRIWFSTEFVDYFPLTMSSLWFEWRLWGMNATGYHITNILLHALAAVFMWRALLRLKVPGAFWAALIFAVHPVNVESVAWITERKNTLCLFFGALSALLFLGSEGISATPRPLNPATRRRWYILALIAFALSLLAKTATVMLPVVFLGVLWWNQQSEGRRVTLPDCLRVAPFFGLSAALALVTIWFQYHRAIEQTVVNDSTFGQRVAIAGRAVWFYLGKALLPINLTFVYPRWEVDSQNIVNFLPALAVIIMLAVLFAFRNRLGKALFPGFGYFVLMLFPVLGFFNIYFQRYSFVADHWQYVSLIGIIAAVVALLSQMLKEKSSAVLAIIAIVLTVLSFQQSKIYRNQETLWRDTLKKNPHCSMAEANWGLFLYNQGRRDEAITHYQAALNLNPKDDGSIFNWGVALLESGNHAEAAEKFEQTLKINPHHKQTLMSLAWLRAINKDVTLRNGPEAVRLAEHGVDLTKNEDEWMLDTLAASYAEAGRFDDAIRTENKAIEVATKKDAADVVQDMKKRLALYQSGQPFHEQ